MNELVERACEAHENDGRGWTQWSDYDESVRDECREDMARALTAAKVPQMLAVVEAARHRGQCHGSVCDCDVKIRAALASLDLP